MKDAEIQENLNWTKQPKCVKIAKNEIKGLIDGHEK